MRVAEHWEDYTLLDTMNGYRFESWGGHKVARPDPQVVWHDVQNGMSRMKNGCEGIYYRSEKGGGHWEFREGMPESWKISYGSLKFRIKPTNFKHMGLFPEQAVNWEFCQRIIREAGRPVNVLNLFAYTGGATLACAAAGASVCHVDAVKGMVSWARENAALSGLAEKPVRWIVEDAMKFVEREIKRGHRYDIIILDPPSYGRGSNGEMWKIEDCIYDLMTNCMELMSDKPLFIMLNSYTTGLSPAAMEYLLHEVAYPRGRDYSVSADEIGLPVTASHGRRILPCGSTALLLFEKIDI